MSKSNRLKSESQYTVPNGTTFDKVERYKWPLHGKPGELAWLDKAILHVDHSYQREDVANFKILAIASEWNWLACGAIVVARRDDKYYVMDGQHRVLAALRRSDVRELPCVIYEVSEVKDEAGAFVALNTFRKPMSAMSKFKALAVCEDEDAAFVASLLDRHGYRASNNPHETTFGIKCVGTLLRLAAVDKDILEAVFAVCADSANGDAIMERPLMGLFCIEQQLRKRGDTIASPRWRPRFVKLSQAEMQRAAEKAAHYHGKGGQRVYADGILTLVNHKCRNRLTLTSEEADAD